MLFAIHSSRVIGHPAGQVKMAVRVSRFLAQLKIAEPGSVALLCVSECACVRVFVQLKIAEPGSVAFNFDRVGLVSIETADGEDAVSAIGAGRAYRATGAGRAYRATGAGRTYRAAGAGRAYRATGAGREYRATVPLLPWRS
jgi:hypothetical protein